MADASTTNLDTLIGRLVVDRGLATQDEVDRALQQLQTRASGGDNGNGHRVGVAGGGGGEAGGGGDPQASIADALVAQGVVTRAQIDRLRPEVEEQRVDRQIPGYRLQGKLGEGAMAKVYKANQLSLDRTVAVKVLPRKFLNKGDFVQRFYAEGKAAAKLNHPNIVQAIDVGQAGEHHYFVMEFVEGRTVFDDLERQGRYSESAALPIAIQVARALEHAHEAGFVHRDVKPKNIMITPDGTAKLADMGLARAVTDREAAEAEAGKAYGTPYYISPEQVRGRTDIDSRADVYGFGATLYHMITGRAPFEGSSPSSVMHKHLKEHITPPDRIASELSAGICEVVEVCMAKDKGDRYASTSDLVTDLEAIARGEAPVYARQRFDLAKLSALEAPAEPKVVRKEVVVEPEPVPLALRPLFWAAVGGWIVAAMLGVLWAITTAA